MLRLLDRLVRAPDNDARMQTLTSLASDRTLRRAGLTRRSSMLGTTLAATGVLAAGVGIGAGVALLFAPSLGKDLRARLAVEYARLTERVGKPTDSVDPRAVAASQIAAHPGRVPVESPHVSNG